jgi:hypothetical protein
VPDLNVLVVEVVEYAYATHYRAPYHFPSPHQGDDDLDDLDDQHVEVWHRARSSVCHVACATHI